MARKNHEAQIISWTGRALYLAWYRAGNPFFTHEPSFSVVGTPGWAPDRPPPFAETPADLRKEFHTRRCFFRAPPLLPGHNPTPSQRREEQK